MVHPSDIRCRWFPDYCPGTHKSAGGILENEMAWKVFGAVLLPVAVFLVMAVVIGPLLVLVDIRRSVRAIETMKNRNSSEALPAELREPYL